ncbi:MAG: hypothetical protein ABI880_01250 [Acidobacteriota bacterium]
MLGSLTRWMLLASGPLNLVGALLFAPPMAKWRQGFGLPAADPFYLWILSAWVLAFGVAYAYMGVTGRLNRGVVAIGAWGKAVFAVLLLALAAEGRASVSAALGAVPDLLMAATFASWVWASSRSAAGPQV